MIPISFEYSADANKLFDRVINLVYLGATLGIMYALFKSLRTSLSGMNKGNDFMGMVKIKIINFMILLFFLTFILLYLKFINIY